MHSLSAIEFEKSAFFRKPRYLHFCARDNSTMGTGKFEKIQRNSGDVREHMPRVWGNLILGQPACRGQTNTNNALRQFSDFLEF